MKGALAEVAFWSDRRTALSNMYEQLNNPLVFALFVCFLYSFFQVRTMLEVLEIADSPNALPFRVQYNELTKQYILAEVCVQLLLLFYCI